MKLAWLVWYDSESRDAGDKPELWHSQPDDWRVFTQIVYCEVTA